MDRMPEQGKNDEQFEKGKNYVLYLLSFGDKSKSEVRERLEKKQYPHPVVEEIVRHLEDSGLLNDERFARGFAFSRIRKGFSWRKIQYLLRKKGVDENTITKVLEGVFSQIDEGKMATELLHRKRYLPVKKELSRKERIKHLSKIYRFLSGHGFSYSTIKKLIEKEMRRP